LSGELVALQITPSKRRMRPSLSNRIDVGRSGAEDRPELLPGGARHQVPPHPVISP
jgi:hypothetical protein